MTDKTNSTKVAVNLHRREFLEKIKKYLPFTSDEEVLILRAQLIAEYYLNSLLGVSLPVTEAYKYTTDQMRYSEKLRKLIELKLLKPNETEAMSRLNKLRNKFGHQIDYKVSEADLDYLGFCFGKSYIEMKYALGNNGEPHPFKDRLWEVLLDVVIPPAGKFWSLVKPE